MRFDKVEIPADERTGKSGKSLGTLCAYCPDGSEKQATHTDETGALACTECVKRERRRGRSAT